MRLTIWKFSAVILMATLVAVAAPPKAPATKKGKVVADFPPELPDGAKVVTDTSDEFLKSPATLREGVTIAKAAPTIDFLYFPEQTYPGNPWSAWGDSVVANGKYYASIGDHAWPAGNAFVFEYDPANKSIRTLVNVKKFLNMPDGHYSPGKIHGRLDMGSDGWLYFATHRGSEKATTDKYHYEGDWILRCDPKTATTEIVTRGPVPKHCIPNTILDSQRMIFYGGTAAGAANDEESAIQFFAYDVKNKKMLFSSPDGPARAMMFAKSTGKLYYVPGTGETNVMRFDPDKPEAPTKLESVKIGCRAASEETPQGLIYVTWAKKGSDPEIWSFNTKTEEAKAVGVATVASQPYIASLHADSTGRFLYYVPGAHGSADRDNTAVVQFDTKTGQRKVVAFLHPFYQEKYHVTIKGTYSLAVDPAGDKIYITWNANRAAQSAWDTAAMTVIHIPESERQ